MSHSLYLNPQLDYPTRFESLGDFNAAVKDAIARHDEALTNYFLECFCVQDNQAIFIHGAQSNTEEKQS